MKPRKPLVLFLASPGDLTPERCVAQEVVEYLDRTLGQQRSYEIVLKAWEWDARPSFVGRAQATINAQIPTYHLFLGLLWKRYGTPSGAAESGTEEEFLLAYERWHRGEVFDLLLYFIEEPFWPKRVEELAQMQKVLEFRSRVERDGLTKALPTRSALADELRVDLFRAVEAVIHRLEVLRFGELSWDSKLVAMLVRAERSAQTQNVRLVTPHILHGMLTDSSSVLHTAMTRIDGALPGTLAREFARYLAEELPGLAGAPTKPADWTARPEVGQVIQQALNAHARLVSEQSFVLTLLQGDGTTIRNLRKRLDGDFDRLLEFVGSYAPPGTPGEHTPYANR